jgi:outer membrane protein assembly factor BamB
VAVAFDKDSGKELWRALDAREPGYAPPTMIEAGGTKQLILWHPQSVNSLDPATGKVFWSHPWEIRAGLSVATPRLAGDLLLLSSFYTSSKCFKLDATKPEAALHWEGKSFSEKNTDTLHSLMSTPFIEDGHIYGVCSYGQLRCLKLDTAERVWETFAATTGDKPVRWANAFLIKHADRFFLANEQGDLIIAKLTPKGYEEISRANLLKPTTTDPRRAVVWSHPAFANQMRLHAQRRGDRVRFFGEIIGYSFRGSRRSASQPVSKTRTSGTRPILRLGPIHGSQPFW